jgi:hypothetical protein
MATIMTVILIALPIQPTIDLPYHALLEWFGNATPEAL